MKSFHVFCTENINCQHPKVLHGTCKCQKCGRTFSLDRPKGVPMPKPYSPFHRNHCPYCLYSIHIDDKYGDRKMWCGHKIDPNGPDCDDNNFKSSLLVPIAKTYSTNDILSLVHKCEKCGRDRVCKIASDDDTINIQKLPLINIKTIR